MNASDALTTACPKPLYLDNHLMVLAKPAGMLAQSDQTGDGDLLTYGKQFLKHYYAKPGKVYLGLVHRLDRPASGLMVFARTSKAAARLASQFKAHTITKYYLAQVEGELQGRGQFSDHLHKEAGRVRVVRATHPRGKQAELHWRAVAHGNGRTLLDIQLVTGRSHQIRVQFASRGHPLLGDLRYGASQVFDGQNLALHSYCLGLEHPTKKEPLQWTLAPPPSWRNHFDSTIDTLLLFQDRIRCY